MSNWILGLPEYSNLSWCPALLICKAQCTIDLCSQRKDLQEQVCGIPAHLSFPCFVPLPSTCGMGWMQKGLESWYIIALPLYPSQCSLFFFTRYRWSVPQFLVNFRVSCICCSCFFVWCLPGRRFCLALLLCQLFLYIISHCLDYCTKMFLLFYKIIFTILGYLHFHINFILNLSLFVIVCWDFDWDCFGSIDSFRANWNFLNF